MGLDDPAMRQRDIFPLPPLSSAALKSYGGSRGCRQRASRRQFWEQWAEEGRTALNEIAGFSGAALGACAPANFAQSRCVSHLRDAYSAFGLHDRIPTEDEALNALLLPQGSYAQPAVAIRPYDASLLSIPEVGEPVPLADGLDGPSSRL